MTTRPTDELRQAAARLLALAADVTPGPWAVHNPNGYPQAVFGESKDVIFAEVLDELDQPKTHAAYIAVMHPGVGAALADWLDQAARYYEAGVQAAAGVFRDDPAGREAFLTTGPGAPSEHALAVARQINAAARP